ncbi:MAG: exodeoxyribonuclease VII small subunit [Propionibacteriaceae bacterium]|nr:exodeoxyribonuclease VII small subunit [Propionibacteriaceae bacterium]
MATARTTKKTDTQASPQQVEPVAAPEAELTYEQARDELISVVTRLESGGESLADSMELFKRGEYLANLCQRYLTEARTVVESAQTP